MPFFVQTIIVVKKWWIKQQKTKAHPGCSICRMYSLTVLLIYPQWFPSIMVHVCWCFCATVWDNKKVQLSQVHTTIHKHDMKDMKAYIKKNNNYLMCLCFFSKSGVFYFVQYTSSIYIPIDLNMAMKLGVNII